MVTAKETDVGKNAEFGCGKHKKLRKFLIRKFWDFIRQHQDELEF